MVVNENDDPEISLDASVTLDEGTELSLELFFLEVTAGQTPGGMPTGLTGSIDVDILGTDGRLPLSDFTDKPFDQLFDVRLGDRRHRRSGINRGSRRRGHAETRDESQSRLGLHGGLQRSESVRGRAA